ncbi:hypothetical protein Celaphus_00006574 [Cervus elaphus hippelaphus]|uniref:Uncharacterized protein n=1 Tax=Cervus elaphus hippelaphus TaxID=46360 RepID=A0A212CTN0_CEREH|nr:hypothetical protein Celaphus_00006574 [Cervus elaphus hippelaphus]
MQMEAILLDKTLRKEWLLAHCRPLLFAQIAGAILLCLIFSLSNIMPYAEDPECVLEVSKVLEF